MTSNLKWSLRLAVAALALAGLWLLMLRPESGWLGGLLFVFTNGLIADLVFFLGALAVAMLFKPMVLRVLVFPIAWCLLGLNTIIPLAITQSKVHPTAEWHVERPVTVPPHGLVASGEEQRTGLALAQTLQPLVSLGNNAGVQLVFETDSASGYKYALQAAAGGWLAQEWKLEPDPGEPFYTYSEEPEPDGNTATATLRVFDAGGETASFTQHGLPRIEAGRWQLQDEGFLERALPLLLHRNVWVSALLARLPTDFAADDFREFRAQAFIAPPPLEDFPPPAGEPKG